MTKQEFDAKFVDGDVFVHHTTPEQWFQICDYAASLGAAMPASMKEHDVVFFPYVTIFGGKLGAYRSFAKEILSFDEFASMILPEETDLFAELPEDFL